MASTAEVVEWLDRNAMSIGSAAPGEPPDDLPELQQVLDGVRVVGMGEVTHGTREFYRLRHRLLRRLVTEMGFTVLAIEGGYSAARRIDDHVVNGVGERSAVLAAFGHALWDVEEFGEALDWIRAHNASVPDAKKVRFHGLDVWNSPVGRAETLDYLRRTARERVPAVEEAFRAVAASERHGLLLAHHSLDVETFHVVRDLMEFLRSDRERLVAMTSPGEHEAVLRQVEVIRQWIVCNISDQVPEELPHSVPRVKGLNIFARSVAMGKNLTDLLTRSGPEAKAVVWAHTLHVGVGFEDDTHGRTTNMGGHLRSCLGDRYYAFGMDFDHGTYLSRDFLPDLTLGDLRVATVPPAPKGTLAWYLAMAGPESFLLDLRRPSYGQEVAGWLGERRVMHCLGWAHSDPPLSTTLRLNETFDGLIFIRKTSSTTPTANAVRAVARRAVH